MYKPSQNNPTQDGTELFSQVIQAPIRTRMIVKASDSFISAMKDLGVDPHQVGSAITEFYSATIKNFVDVNRQQIAIGGVQQHRRQINVPGMQVDYRNNQGAETLEYTVYPEASYGVEVYGERTDILLDGYVFIVLTTMKAIPTPTPGYWIQLGTTLYHVDFIDFSHGPPRDSGIGWSPFNSMLGLFDPNAWVVGAPGGVTNVLCISDITLVNHTDPFTWQLPDLSTAPGGFEFPAVPIPDSVIPVTIFCNGKAIVSFGAPVVTATTRTRVLLTFGKDAIREHSVNDALQPPGTKLLNKIFPTPDSLPGYVFLNPDNTPGVVFNDIRQAVPDGILDKFGRNLFTTDCPDGMSFVAEFYDRKTHRKVVQSPHYAAQGSSLILVNDEPLGWNVGISDSDGSFSSTEPVVVNFKDPSEVLSFGGGG